MITEKNELELAQELGFEKATKSIGEIKNLRDRLAPIYERYRYVTQQDVDAFCVKLKATTGRYWGQPGLDLKVEYDTLKYYSVSDYPEVPPRSALIALQEARATGYFDTFEIAKVQTTRTDLDPILFGRVDGCPDRFFICEWGSDVSINDLIGENGG